MEPGCPEEGGGCSACAVWPRGPAAAEGEGCHCTELFPSPSAQGPSSLMGSPVPPLGSRETSDWLGL